MSVVSMFVDNTESDRAALRCAITLATKCQRPLDVVCALPDAAMAPTYVGGAFSFGMGMISMDAILEAEKALEEKTRSAFEEIVTRKGFPTAQATFVRPSGMPESAAADQAVLADAIVFSGAASRGEHILSPAFFQVLMHSRLPVISAGGNEPDFKTAIIAWDGSNEVARSVAQHAKIIAAHERVIVAQSEKGLKTKDRRTAHEPGRLVSWLSGRGVEATIQVFDGSPGSGLLQLAQSEGAGIIVSGAYGRSRAGEFLFGGVTKTLLNAEDRPALALSH